MHSKKMRPRWGLLLVGVAAATDTFPERNTDNERVPLSWMMEWFSANETQLPRMRRCALVGGSAVLVGARRGAEIDAHDTVIRVNRLPRFRDAADVGNRTDIIFTNMEAANHANVAEMGGKRIGCRDLTCTVVFKGVCNSKRQWPPVAEKWRRQCPGVAVGHQRNDVALGVCGLDMFRNSQGRRQVTSGFLGFVAFAPVCESLTVYGFGGNVSAADGHKQLSHHDTAAENALIDSILATGRLDSALDGTAAQSPSSLPLRSSSLPTTATTVDIGPLSAREFLRRAKAARTRGAPQTPAPSRGEETTTMTQPSSEFLLLQDVLSNLNRSGGVRVVRDSPYNVVL